MNPPSPVGFDPQPPLSGGLFFHLLVGGHRFYPPDKGGQGGCFSSREGCPIYPLKSGLFQQPREESDCSFLSLAAPPSSVGADPPRISRRTKHSASSTIPHSSIGIDLQGVVEKPPQGKNACGVFTVLARNTSCLVGLQTNPRSSLGLTFITRVKHSFITRA